MYILALLIEIVAIYAAVKYRKQNRKRKSNRIPKEKTVVTQTKADTEKAQKQKEKEMQQAEKIRQKKEQAEADKQFLESQLNRYTEMLSKADTELLEIENQIKIDYFMRSYDKAAKKEKQKEQIIKRIISLETKVHTAETRLAKANYIIQAV